jgi:TP901 family phage tail tape measure protein
MAENNVDVSTLAIKVATEGADKAKRDLNDVGDAAEKTEARTDRLSESTARLVAKYVSIAAVAAAAGQALRFSVGEFVALEAATANLSAKTGLAGESLAIMVERAKELAGATTQTAASILDAAEQVEGLVPRLGGNAEAIAEVTRQAVILAEATGDELQPSVFAVGQALAQFGGDALDAARYANALVAAAQSGAAEVQDLAGQFERVGPAAARAGVSFEQTLAAMELLANRGIRGREAVGGLKEFFDRLATSANSDYNPALVGLETALGNIAAANLTAAERADLFGEAAADVANVIVGSLPEYSSLEDRITGTSAATEQASARLATFEAQSKILSNELASLGAEIGGTLVPYLVSLATEAGGVVRALREITDESGEAGGEVDTFAGVLRAGALAGLAFTNTLGLAVRTAETLVGVLPSALASIFNPAAAFAAYSEATDKIAADYEATVERLERARDRLTTPDASPGVLDRPAPDSAGSGSAVDDEIDGYVAAYQRQVAARREAAEAIAKIDRETEDKRLAFIDEIQGEVWEKLNESTNDQIDLATEGELQKFQAEADFAERLAEFRLERREELAELQEEWFDTDLERLLERAQQREDATNEFFDSVELPNEAERRDRLFKLQQQKEAEITQLFRRGAFIREQFETASAKNRTVGVLGELERMTAGIAQHNKTAFNINKAAAIASALVALPAHVSETMSKFPFPYSVAMGALAAAASLAQINAIRSASFEGGGGGTTPSAAGSTPTINGNPVGGPSAPPPDLTTGRAQGSQIQIIVAGNNVMGDNAVQDFAERLRDMVNDRDATVFGSGSRQAQDIVVIPR